MYFPLYVNGTRVHLSNLEGNTTPYSKELRPHVRIILWDVSMMELEFNAPVPKVIEIVSQIFPTYQSDG